jgi:hypothetical protein
MGWRRITCRIGHNTGFDQLAAELVHHDMRARAIWRRHHFVAFEYRHNPSPLIE